MSLHIYGMNDIDFSKSEMRQYERVKKELIEEFSEEELNYYMIVDYIVGNKQYDLIFFKNESIIIVDLKGYSGIVKGYENGDWFVETPDEGEIKIDQAKNPFQQMRDQRYEFLEFLNKHLQDSIDRFDDQNLQNISAVICFENGSSYDINQIEASKHLWFDVITEDEIVDYIKNADSEEFFLKDCEIESLFSNLDLKEKGEEETEKIEVSKGVLSDEDMINITETISKEYMEDDFILQDLVDLIEPETAVRYLKDAEEMGILEECGDGQGFVLTDNFEEKLPKTDEDSEVDVNINRFSDDDFYLKPENPEVGEEYDGVYRGTEYSLNYKREVWWRRDWEHPKHMVEFSDEEILDKILDLKPQGGSFRITEAGEVLTKKYDDEEKKYIPIYIGEFDGEIEFEDFDWNPDVEKGSLWPAPYDGSKFSVNSNNRELKVNIGGVKTSAIEGHEELVKKVLKFKHNGGSFKINENGKILTLLYEAPYPERIQEQINNLTDEEKNLIDIRSDASIDEMVPIYIGEFSGNIKFNKVFDIHKEWTEEDDKEFLDRIGAR